MAGSGERLRLIIGLGALVVLAAVAAFVMVGDDDVATEAAPILPGQSFAASPSTTPDDAGEPVADEGDPAPEGESSDDATDGEGAPAEGGAMTDEGDRQVVVVAGSEAATGPASDDPSTTSPATTASTSAPSTTSTTVSTTTAAPSTAPPTTPAPTTAAPTTAAPTTAAPTTPPPSTAPPTTSPPADNPTGGGDRDLERRVIDLTNQRRAENGCPPLAANNRLHAAALGHSIDMATQDYFSHTSLDGSSMSDRIDRQGYGWRRLAENIAAGYPSPEAVVEGWMNSPGHRANILNCDLTEIGVGHYQRYWTQNFGTPR